MSDTSMGTLHPAESDKSRSQKSSLPGIFDLGSFTVMAGVVMMMEAMGMGSLKLKAAVIKS